MLEALAESCAKVTTLNVLKAIARVPRPEGDERTFLLSYTIILAGLASFSSQYEEARGSDPWGPSGLPQHRRGPKGPGPAPDQPSSRSGSSPHFPPDLLTSVVFAIREHAPGLAPLDAAELASAVTELVAEAVRTALQREQEGGDQARPRGE